MSGISFLGRVVGEFSYGHALFSILIFFLFIGAYLYQKNKVFKTGKLYLWLGSGDWDILDKKMRTNVFYKMFFVGVVALAILYFIFYIIA